MPLLRLLHESTALHRLLLSVAVIACVGFVAPDVASASALAIAVSTLCAVFLLPPVAGLPSHVYGPVLGALAMIACSHWIAGVGGAAAPIGVETLADEATGHAAVPLLILSFAYLCLSLDHSGFFRWSALQIMRLARGDGRGLLLWLFAGVSALTFFTSNDIVILSVTPILIHLALLARITNPTPLLVTQFVAANTASMGLYVGNPTNVILGSAAGLEFVEYARRMAVPTLIATVTALSLLLWIFLVGSRHNRVPRRYEVLPDCVDHEAAPDMFLKIGAFAACLATLAVLGGPRGARSALGDLDTASTMALVSAGFAATLCLYDYGRARASGQPVVRRLWRRMPFEIVPFLISFCVIVRGLEGAGLTRAAMQTIEDAFRHGALAGSIATGLIGVFAVNLTNNIPAAILFEKSWLGDAASSPPLMGLQERLAALDPRYPGMFLDGALYATNFGANLTFAGALAGLMWLRIVRDARLEGRAGTALARDFMGYGALIVPVVTVVTCVSIAWSHAGPR